MFVLSFSIYSLPVLNKHVSLIWLINWIAQEQCVCYRCSVTSLPIGPPRGRIGLTPWSLFWRCVLIALAKMATTHFFLCMCEGFLFICKEEKDSLINLRGVSVVTGIGYVVCVAWYLTHTASVFTGFGDGISVFILVIHTFGFYSYLWSARVIIACSLGSVLLLVDNSYVWNGICILITAYYSYLYYIFSNSWPYCNAYLIQRPTIIASKYITIVKKIKKNIKWYMCMFEYVYVYVWKDYHCILHIVSQTIFLRNSVVSN